VSNQVASVRLPKGWSKDSVSTADDLFLDGPRGVNVEFYSAQEASSYTLTNYFQSRLSQLGQKFPDAKLCGQAQAAKLPGNGPEGVAAPICLTLTSQNGPAVPYVIYEFAGLVQGSGFQQLFVAGVVAPQDLSGSALNSLVGPVWGSVRWLQLTGG